MITAQNIIAIRLPPPRYAGENLHAGICGGSIHDTLPPMGPQSASALYYGANQVGLSVIYAANSTFQFRLIRYLTTPVNGSTPVASWNGTSLYAEPYSSSLILNTIINQSLPQNYPIPVDGNGIPQSLGAPYQTNVEIDIPTSASCYPLCTLQFKANIYDQTYVSCSDVVILPRDPVCKYLSLRAEGCCPLSVSSLSSRISSALSSYGFVGTTIPNYIGQDNQFLTNTWNIMDQQDAPHTLRVNPATGLYAAQICVDGTFNRTSASMLQVFQQQQQAVSFALSSGTGPTDIIVKIGDIPDTYVGYNAGSHIHTHTYTLSLLLTVAILLITRMFH